MRHRCRDHNLVSITNAQLLDWAARIVRLAHSVEDEVDQRAMFDVGMEIKAAMDMEEVS